MITMTFEEDVARRHKLFLDHPLIQARKNRSMTTTQLMPVPEKIAQIREAIDCYQGRIDQLYAELAIYEDEQ